MKFFNKLNELEIEYIRKEATIKEKKEKKEMWSRTWKRDDSDNISLKMLKQKSWDAKYLVAIATRCIVSISSKM